MGNGNQKEALYEAVDADDCDQVRVILKAHPEIVNEPISEENTTTPLERAAWRGNVEMIYTLLEFHADVNFVGPQQVSALQWASQRGKDEAVDFLVQKGAKLDYISREKLNALDYAILYGSYNTAWKLINLGLEPKGPEYYKAMSNEKHILYYDYEQMIEHLKKKTPLESCPPFNIPPPEPGFKDPVIDPRETWGQFAQRIINFEEPPLVERADLPPELRPENRLLGKLRSLINGQSPYPEEMPVAPEGSNERSQRPERPKEHDIITEKKKKAEESVELTSEEAGKHDEDEENAAERYDHVVDMPVDAIKQNQTMSDRKGSEETGVNYSTDKLIQAVELQPVKVAVSNAEDKNNEQAE